ncbi:hypothetical protein D3C73_776200 [compost metagenome]
MQRSGRYQLSDRQRIIVFRIGRIPEIGAADPARDPGRIVEDFDIADTGRILGGAYDTVIHHPLVMLECTGDVFCSPGQLIGAGLDEFLTGNLCRKGFDHQHQDDAGGIERIEALRVQLLGRCGEIIPAFRRLKAGLLIDLVIEVEGGAGNGNRYPVKLAVDHGRRQLAVVPLGQVKLAGKLLEIGKTIAVLGELEEPRPVDLDDIGLGAAGHLRRQLFEITFEAGKLGLDLMPRLRRAVFQSLLRGDMATIATPPGHAQIRRRSEACGNHGRCQCNR